MCAQIICQMALISNSEVNTEEADPIPSSQQELQDQQYPPNEAGIKKMVLYLLKEKKTSCRPAKRTDQWPATWV